MCLKYKFYYQYTCKHVSYNIVYDVYSRIFYYNLEVAFSFDQMN